MYLFLIIMCICLYIGAYFIASFMIYVCGWIVTTRNILINVFLILAMILYEIH